jgi:hypothetical protein
LSHSHRKGLWRSRGQVRVGCPGPDG